MKSITEMRSEEELNEFLDLIRRLIVGQVPFQLNSGRLNGEHALLLNFKEEALG